MRITTIVATLNAVNTLDRALESFAVQDHSDKELIVVDGGSTDGTLDVIRRHERQIAHWISEPDRGIFDAWNKALKRESGEWVHFLGADDVYASREVLSSFSRTAASADPSATKVIYGRVVMTAQNGEVTRLLGEAWDPIAFRTSGMTLPHQGVFHHATLFQRFGNFSEAAGLAADYELLLRHLKASSPQFVPELLVACMQDGGLSSNPANYLHYHQLHRQAQRDHGTQRWTGPALVASGRIYTIHLMHRLAPTLCATALRRWRARKLSLRTGKYHGAT